MLLRYDLIPFSNPVAPLRDFPQRLNVLKRFYPEGNAVAALRHISMPLPLDNYSLSPSAFLRAGGDDVLSA